MANVKIADHQYALPDLPDSLVAAGQSKATAAAEAR